jgi:hypothetical protein
LEFVEHVPAALHRYRFARKTADFVLCKNCGTYLGAMMRSEPKGFGIINVRVLHSLAGQLAESVSMDYERETLAERVARRESRWTPIAAG